jgi:predicted esterase
MVVLRRLAFTLGVLFSFTLTLTSHASELPPDVVFPPVTGGGGRMPVTVFLHGMCDTPENECTYFAEMVTRHGWLVCPRAPVACTGGGTAWSATKRTELVEAAIERLRRQYPDRVADDERTLIGFSLGGFAAADILQRGDRRYSRALIIAAKAPFDSKKMLDSGVARILFAAGDYDASKATMVTTAQRLSRRGVDARFSSLGKVGHQFAVDMGAWLESALEWLWSERSVASRQQDSPRRPVGAALRVTRVTVPGRLMLAHGALPPLERYLGRDGERHIVFDVEVARVIGGGFERLARRIGDDDRGPFRPGAHAVVGLVRGGIQRAGERKDRSVALAGCGIGLNVTGDAGMPGVHLGSLGLVRVASRAARAA